MQVAVATDGALTYRLEREKLRTVRGREGRYLLRTNLSADDPELIWRCYRQLCFVEEAFRTLKGDLGLRPIFHQLPDRIEAHLFIAFLAYCLSITLRQQLRSHAGGLMPRAVLEKLATVQMLDVAVPTTDDRELLLVRRTEPSRDVQLLLDHLNLTLPPQPPPRILAKQALEWRPLGGRARKINHLSASIPPIAEVGLAKKTRRSARATCTAIRHPSCAPVPPPNLLPGP